MFCSNCGQEVSESALFCMYCGNKIDEPFQGKQSMQVEKDCFHHFSIPTCPHCGGTNVEKYRKGYIKTFFGCWGEMCLGIIIGVICEDIFGLIDIANIFYFLSRLSFLLSFLSPIYVAWDNNRAETAPYWRMKCNICKEHFELKK